MLATVPGRTKNLETSGEETPTSEGEQGGQKEQPEGPERKHPP